MANKERVGNFFEDFRLGQVIRHGTPRTLTDGDSALYVALTGARQPLHSSVLVAKNLGYEARPIDDLLIFNVAFGKTVPDISLNAVANLGYAELRFLRPVFAGDTLRCESVVIGLKENSNRKSGIVYVRSTCYSEADHAVLSWVRWVMVHKARPDAACSEQHVPLLSDSASPDQLEAHARIRNRESLEDWCEATGSSNLWDDYQVGERINHPSGMTIEEADHMIATRLYQNNARPHFDSLLMANSGVGRRLVYGGHVISIARALSYDGLENVISILAFNAGTHVAPTVAGDTLYAYSEILDKVRIPGRMDVGALRLRLVGIKNAPAEQVTSPKVGQGSRKLVYHPNVVLDLDYTVLMPRKPSNGARRA
jgi:2-methylfumaryl-CoA hydratase